MQQKIVKIQPSDHIKEVMFVKQQRKSLEVIDD